MNYFSDLLETGVLEDVKTSKTKNKPRYIDVPTGFDIETTSTEIQQQKMAFMYIWAFSMGVDAPVYYGRTWDDFIYLLSFLSHNYGLNSEFRLPVYIHNLGYEFQFIRHHLNWIDVFSVDERKPIKATCSLGIEFRDSYILSGYSLANTAKNLTKHNIKKLEGDLDYDLIRTHETPLTETEMCYVENDVQIVTSYIDEQIDLYGNLSKVPMTNTGRVRKYVRNECYYNNSSHKKSSKGKYQRYRKIMGDLKLDPETYIQLKRAFMGGFTHSNPNKTGVVLDNVSGVDFTSSYPSVMLSEKFPMSKFRDIEITNMEEFNYLCSNKAVVFNAKFENIEPLIENESYISESKCFNLKGSVVNNGRVYMADELEITLTEVDFEIIKKCYKWESLHVKDVKYAHKGYLPKAILKSILDLYQNKTKLKGVEGYEVEYLLSKGMLNSIYGMSVTDIVKDQVFYDEEWGVEKVDIEEEIENYNESKNRFLYFPWGVWVTAYSRKNLFSGILAVGNDYVYSDTDSMKLLNYENHKEYFEWFNNDIYNKMLSMCKTMGFDPEMLSPQTKEGEHKTMGVWDYEGLYEKFKTLGAKRYLLIEDGELYLTVAGLSKSNGSDYLIELGGDIHGAFDFFDDELYVPANRTGKMTHTYIDSEMKAQIKDYKGKVSNVKSLSSIHLEKCDFTLSVSERYRDFLNKIGSGYVYKGVKQV